MIAQRADALDYSWLRDDREEDLVGADWHQDAIRALSTSLQALVEERQWPWHIGDQLTLVGLKPDGKVWRPCPDISIHPHLGPARRQEIDVRADGPPALVIEVASATTWRYDVSMERIFRGKRQAGKAFGYLSVMRIPEYLVFDPYETFLDNQVEAWRRVGEMVRPWRPDAGSSYHSEMLDLSFRPDGPLLRVCDPAGNPVPYWFENAAHVRALTHDITTRDQELAMRAQEIARLRAEIERLHRD